MSPIHQLKFTRLFGKRRHRLHRVAQPMHQLYDLLIFVWIRKPFQLVPHLHVVENQFFAWCIYPQYHHDVSDHRKHPFSRLFDRLMKLQRPLHIFPCFHQRDGLLHPLFRVLPFPPFIVFVVFIGDQPNDGWFRRIPTHPLLKFLHVCCNLSAFPFPISISRYIHKDAMPFCHWFPSFNKPLLALLQRQDTIVPSRITAKTVRRVLSPSRSHPSPLAWRAALLRFLHIDR